MLGFFFIKAHSQAQLAGIFANVFKMLYRAAVVELGVFGKLLKDDIDVTLIALDKHVLICGLKPAKRGFEHTDKEGVQSVFDIFKMDDTAYVISVFQNILKVCFGEDVVSVVLQKVIFDDPLLATRHALADDLVVCAVFLYGDTVIDVGVLAVILGQKL